MISFPFCDRRGSQTFQSLNSPWVFNKMGLRNNLRTPNQAKQNPKPKVLDFSLFAHVEKSVVMVVGMARMVLVNTKNM